MRTELLTNPVLLLSLAVLAVCPLPGCDCGGGDDDPVVVDGGTDAGADAGADAAPPESIDEIPMAETIGVAGLEAPVDVIWDQDGVPHVFAENLHDVAAGQGFAQARDRFVQLELGRRQAKGEMTELIGLPGITLAEDQHARRVGYRRIAEAIVGALPPGGDAEAALDGYAAGVNAYIARLRTGDETTSVTVIQQQLELIQNWSPVDSAALGELVSASQSYEHAADAWWMDYYDTLRATFDPASADPDLAARAGAAADLNLFAPTGRVAVLEAPFVERRALRLAPVLARPRLDPAARVDLERWQEVAERVAARWGGSSGAGSNSWVVAGNLTESGEPLLANDPHLRLGQPSALWQVHLDTALRRGATSIRAIGHAFPGVPGILSGLNDSVAWGITNALADITDVYLEEITPGAEGAPDTVTFQGGPAAIEIIAENIPTGPGTTEPFEVEWVPHHGALYRFEYDHGERVDTSEADTGLSIRWAEYENLWHPEAHAPFDAVLGLLTADSVDDVETALAGWSLPLNWVAADDADRILYTMSSVIPVRDPRATTFDPSTGEGLAPRFVLPGTGDAEWIAFVPREDLPRETERDWIVTANNDQTGASFDGNPFNGDLYIGCAFESGGLRADRLTELMTELAARGGITADDTHAMQADHRSPLGARVVPHVLAAMERAAQEAAAPGTHPDLEQVVAAAAADWPAVTDLTDRLHNWSFEATTGLAGEPQAAVDDAIATTVFQFTLLRLLAGALGDELAAADIPSGNLRLIRPLVAMLDRPAELQAVVDGESVLWDDLGTPGVLETKDAILVRALVGALGDLRSVLGPLPDDWRWGLVHTVRMSAPLDLLPPIPARRDPDYPDGLPHAGDQHGVEAMDYASFGLPVGHPEYDFSFTNGPAARMVVDLAGGPHGRAIIAGGQSLDSGSAHHDDQAFAWNRHETHPLSLDEADLLATWEHRVRLVPAN